MYKKIFGVFKYIFENGPNIGFWIGLIYLFFDWLTTQNIIVIISTLTIPILAIYLVIIKIYKELRESLLKLNIESGLKESSEVGNGNKTKLMIDNLPSKTDLKTIYKYALQYAKSWASDGTLEDINYYLKLDNNKISKSAQIYIRSGLRGEILAFYLPKYYKVIEEIDGYDRSLNMIIKHIYMFKYWKQSSEKALENSSSDIDKSDNINLQISPSGDSLSINLTFSIGTRSWRKRYTLKDNSLMLNNNLIYKFN